MILSDVYDGDYILIQGVSLNKTMHIGIDRNEQLQLFEYLQAKLKRDGVIS